MISSLLISKQYAWIIDGDNRNLHTVLCRRKTRFSFVFCFLFFLFLFLFFVFCFLAVRKYLRKRTVWKYHMMIEVLYLGIKSWCHDYQALDDVLVCSWYHPTKCSHGSCFPSPDICFIIFLQCVTKITLGDGEYCMVVFRSRLFHKNKKKPPCNPTAIFPLISAQQNNIWLGIFL